MAITLETSKPVYCTCGNHTFIQGAYMRKISPLHPDNRDGIEKLMVIPVWICAKCKRGLSETEPLSAPIEAEHEAIMSKRN